jgi:adenosylmethionine-8-amino-7-oxononanoate aminotransferase
VAPSSRGGPSPMKKFLERALARGAYPMARYNVFLVAPPFVVAEDEVEEGVRAVDGALDDIGA